MAFELTKSVIDDVIFSMEDQNAEFVFDAKNLCVVPLDSLDESEGDDTEENENLYSVSGDIDLIKPELQKDDFEILL